MAEQHATDGYQDAEAPDQGHGATIGETLRAAREAQKLSLDDVANQTRIPLRHLEAIEASEWDKLPAPTYTIGFAKSYASAVGLDRNMVADSVREEMGSPRPSAMSHEVFEPIDPARTMPRWLVIAAIAAIIVAVIGLTWINEQSLRPDDAPAEAVAEDAPAAEESAAVAMAPQPQAEGPVTINAREAVWIQVSERGGRTLFQGELTNGQRYQVPTSATAPVLRTGKPEALQLMIGSTELPPVGPPATTVSNVSLLASDLRGQTPPSR